MPACHITSPASCGYDSIVKRANQCDIISVKQIKILTCILLHSSDNAIERLWIYLSVRRAPVLCQNG